MALSNEQVGVVSRLVSETQVDALIADLDPITKIMDKNISKTFSNKTFQSGTTVNVKINDQPLMPVQQTQLRVDPVVQSEISVTVLNWTTGQNLQTIFEALVLGGKDWVKKTVIMPRVETMAAQIAEIAYTQLMTCPNFIGTAGTAVKTATDFGTARAALTNQLAKGYLYCGMQPDDMAQVSGDLAGKFNPTSDSSTAYLKGVVNQAAGFQMFESTQIPYHSNGSAVGTGAAGMALSAAPASGATSITVSGGTANGVITENSLIYFPGKFAVQPQTKQTVGQLRTFRVTETVQLSGSGVGTISIFPPIVGPENPKSQTISALPTTDYVGIEGAASATYRQMLFMKKNSSALIGVEQEDLIGGAINSTAFYDGLPVQSAFAGDITNRQNQGRSDFLGAALNLQWRHQWRAFTARVD
jgi:hypothetical protein